MKEDQTHQSKLQENEVDLGVFFSLIGKIFKKIGLAFQTVVLAISEFFLAILLFIKRKILWLALGSLIGFGVGVYRYVTKGASYYSDMVVRANFESSRLLYNRIEYFNSLLIENKIEDLAVAFNLPPEDARKLKSFEIVPVDDDLEAAKLYRNTFLEYSRADTKGVDTLWAKTMEFEEFKEKLSPYDFPLHRIRVYSGQFSNYSRIEEGLIQSIENNKTIEKVKQATVEMFKDEETILNRSLLGLDSLRQAYNKEIAYRGTASPSGGNSLVVSDQNLRNPEIDLYDKELQVKDELINVKRKAIEQQNTLQVYAGFNPSGTKDSRLSQDFIKFTWISFLITFGLLLLIELYKYLNSVDQKEIRKVQKRQQVDFANMD